MLDVVCDEDKKSEKIALIGSCFFFGTFSGSFVLPQLSDIYGRKPLFLVGVVLYIISVLGMYFSTNLYVLYALLVLGGIAETGRYYVAYVYAIEIMPKRVQNMAGLYIFMVFSISKVFVCLYFWLSKGKEWKTCAYAALILATYSLIFTTIYLPESPRFLVG